MYCLNGGANAYMFWRWSGFSRDIKQLVWRFYGHFTRLMTVGSVFGALASLCYMQVHVYFYSANGLRVLNAFDDMQLIQRQYALMSAWNAAYFVFYSLSFTALTSAQLMILNRLLGFIDELPACLNVSLNVVCRFIIGFVTIGNIFAFCGHIAAASFASRASSLNSQAADAWDTSQNSTKFKSLSLEYGREYDKQSIAESVAKFSQAAVLIMIVTAFAASGTLALRRLRSALDSSAVSVFARRLRLKVYVTVAVVFCTFLMRAFLAIMLAVSEALSDFDSDCPMGTCSSCYNVYTHIQVWVLFTPEFETVIILISAPLASLVALWGMTSERLMSFIHFQREDSLNSNVIPHNEETSNRTMSSSSADNFSMNQQ
jgi:hypothetical protein